MIVELGIAGLVGSILAFGRKKPDRSRQANGHGLAPGNPMQLPPLIRAVVEGRGTDRLALIGAIAEARVYGLAATMEVLEKKLIVYELEQARQVQAPPTAGPPTPAPETAAQAALAAPTETPVTPAETIADQSAEDLLATPGDDVAGPADPVIETIAVVPEEPAQPSGAQRSRRNGKSQKIEVEEKPATEVAARKEG